MNWILAILFILFWFLIGFWNAVWVLVVWICGVVLGWLGARNEYQGDRLTMVNLLASLKAKDDLIRELQNELKRFEA